MKLQALHLAAVMAGASAFSPYAGPDLESFDFVYQVPDGPALRIAGSKPRGRDAPAVVFLAPGGTEVWQADKTFEWLLATAFGPERS